LPSCNAICLSLLPLQDGFTAELSRERDELKAKLESCKAALRDSDSKLENSKEDSKQLQYRLERLDEKLEAKDRCGSRLPVCHCTRYGAPFMMQTC
jgi:septal ring factor EnvC (AmiA/AmiB activator)